MREHDIIQRMMQKMEAHHVWCGVYSKGKDVAADFFPFALDRLYVSMHAVRLEMKA